MRLNAERSRKIITIIRLRDWSRNLSTLFASLTKLYQLHNLCIFE